MSDKSLTRQLEEIGPYKVTRELGRGGMGVVYRARHSKLDCVVAIEVLPKDSIDVVVGLLLDLLAIPQSLKIRWRSPADRRLAAC